MRASHVFNKNLYKKVHIIRMIHTFQYEKSTKILLFIQARKDKPIQYKELVSKRHLPGERI